MAYTDHLVGFALAAVRRAQHFERAGITHCAEVFPELRGDRPVIGVLHHALELAVLDQLAPFAAELEFVACVIDGPGAIARHQDAVLDVTDQTVQRLVTRFDIQVGHAVDGGTVPAGGAAVGDACQAAAVLRQGTAERALQQAVTNQELLAG